MKRLIDANALAERIQCSPLFKNFGEDGLFIREFILECIEEAKTVDVAEIVRCENCVWYNRTSKHSGQCKLHRLDTTNDFYCELGRRTEE